jgi:uncharacterized protein
MYTKRLITPRLEKLMEHFPVVVVSGARQVGKSTLLKNVFPPETDYVVFDPFTDVENARTDPDLFLDNHPRRPLLLDEIQYAPELAAVIKRRVDENRANGQFVLTGSQQWQVMKSLSESLAGRVAFLDLEGFCLAELARGSGESWLARWLESPAEVAAHAGSLAPLPGTLTEILWRGALPEATRMPLELVPSFFEAYLRTYIDRDARQMGDVSDWRSFGRFVRLSCALTAQETNSSQIGREIGATPQTARRWLDMLSATFQWHDVPAFSGNAVKRVSGKSKGYVSDSGLACHGMLISSPRALSSHPALGAIFETAVVSEIRKQCGLLAVKPSMYHWRTAGGAEVDIVLERDGKLYPMEVKAKSNPSRIDATGIAAFRKTYPGRDVQPGLVIAPARAMARISDHDYALPWNLVLEPVAKTDARR